jgi:type I restriction enzyme S subunit
MTREYLLDNFELKRVIKMKGQFFSNTGIQPSILFFENTGFSTSKVEFWEVEQDSKGVIVENMLLSVPRDNLDESCSLDMRRYQEVAAVVNTGGFPVVKLGDVCDSQNGKILSMVDIKEGGGEYPIMSGGRSYCGNYNKYNRDNETISISKTGSSSGCAVWHNTRYWAADCMTITPKDNSNTLLKYVYYLMITKQDYIYENYQRTGVMPHCYWQDISQFQFSLPPLHIQQEIVTALDFIYGNVATAKTAATSVKSQMAAVVRSVGARGFERKHIKDVMNVVSGKANQDREVGRPVPYYDSNGVIGYVTEPLYTGEYTITARNLSIGAVHYINGPFYPSDHTINFTSLDQNIMNNRFFYNWLHLNNQVLKELSSGIKPGIRKSDVAEILMPVPPIEFQHEVLAILNEMEAELATLEQMAAKAEQRAKFILDGYLTRAK